METSGTGRSVTSYRWVRTGDEAFAVMLAAIDSAQLSVRLETYIFTDCALGAQFRTALTNAALRGIRVRVLVDAFGSLFLSDSFWDPLRGAGGTVRWFNPFSLGRIVFRNHRKLLVCDDNLAVVGGFNIASEYQGDGVTQGWRDLGLCLEGPLCRELAASFDRMLARADFRHKRFARLRQSMILESSRARSPVARRLRRWLRFRFRSLGRLRNATLLLSGPGRGFGSLKRALPRDLAGAQTVRIMSAYFLPTWRIRRELMRLARGGGRVCLLLAGPSDVSLAKLACQRLYQPLLRAGIMIYEYQPQILHAKLFVADNLVYVGSANLDVRSLDINYELALRLRHPQLAAEAAALFDDALTHCRRIDPLNWRQSRSFWTKLKERWAYFILARLDRCLARRSLRYLRY